MTTIRTPNGEFGVRATAADADVAPDVDVVCLHGFPDDASTFDEVAARLAARGHRVTSVCLRGYSPSPTKGDLSLDSLARDLSSIAREIGGGAPVVLLAHDYGAQIAYAALSGNPHLFLAAVLLSGPHPAAISRNTWRHPRQVWLSRYILFFQFGSFADKRVARNDFAALDRLWDRWSPHGIDNAHRARVKDTIRRSMPAPIAMYRGGGFSVGTRRIPVPTLFITGEADGCSLPAMSNGQQQYFSGPYERQIWPGVGHFPQLENPERTAKAVHDWLVHARADNDNDNEHRCE